MGPLDASFLYIEDQVSHMHIGSLAVFEGPRPQAHEVRRLVAGKLPRLARYRQLAQFVPLDLGRPLWVDDAHFDLDYHLRRSALPAPGGDDELRALMGRVMSQPLERSRPLWELWAVEGLEHDRWALLSKVHHSMMDGISGTDLLGVLLDSKRDQQPAVVEEEWRPAHLPSRARLVTDAVRGLLTSPYRQREALRSAFRHGSDVVRGTVSALPIARPVPPTSLSGPIGPLRRWDWARASLADLMTIRRAFGGTVNDVVLTVITRGFRDLLLSREEVVERRVVRSLVPVSVRRPSERGTYNNRVSAMFAELPVGIEDPCDRLEAIENQMEHLKESKETVAGEVLMSLAGFMPPTLLALGDRVFTRLPQRSVQTITTNVPGPRLPLYALGRQMLEAFPYVPIQGHIRIAVAIFSYNGEVSFGVTADYDTGSDIRVLCQGIEDGVSELLKLT